MAKALSAEESPLLERFNEHGIRATHATMVGVETASTNFGHDNVKTARTYLHSKKYERTAPFLAVVNDSL